MRPRRLGWAALAVLPSPALAHYPVPGLEGFYTGLAHPYSTPAQALAVLGLGLLIGWLTPQQARIAFAVFLAATLAGALTGLLTGGATGLHDLGLYLAGFAAAALSALLPGRLAGLVLALTALGGWLLGVVSLAEPGPVQDRIITSAGAVLGANLGPFCLYGLSQFARERFPRPWLAIALRVAGAWLAAIALVMAALLTQAT